MGFFDSCQFLGQTCSLGFYINLEKWNEGKYLTLPSVTFLRASINSSLTGSLGVLSRYSIAFWTILDTDCFIWPCFFVIKMRCSLSRGHWEFSAKISTIASNSRPVDIASEAYSGVKQIKTYCSCLFFERNTLFDSRLKIASLYFFK